MKRVINRKNLKDAWLIIRLTLMWLSVLFLLGKNVSFLYDL